MKLHDLLNKLEAQERDLLKQEVLAPVLASHPITVRVAGVVCQLSLDDAQFQGWGVVQPLSTDRAQLMRQAGLGEVQKYLQLLPAVRLLLVTREDNVWSALPAQAGDARLRLVGPVPVLLAEDGLEPYDAVLAHFDGRNFWYGGRDARRNPALAAYLRQSFQEALPPHQLQKQGLSREERAAYTRNWNIVAEARRREEARRHREEALRRHARERRERGEVHYRRGEAHLNRDGRRLAAALEHAEGELLSYVERSDVYTVTYRVRNRTHTSLVRKDDLTVMTSGICLSGRDRDFDLTSVVGVMRQAADIGHEMDDEYY